VTKQDFIHQQLSKLDRVEWPRPNQARIVCPFHDDTNPSLDIALERIDKGGGRGVAVGGFNCWSCQAHGGWNKLAEKLGLEKWTEMVEKEAQDRPVDLFQQFVREQQTISHYTEPYEKPVTDGPWEGSWRGLSGAFLRSVGAESLWDKEYGEYRVYLPVSDATGVLVGHVLARADNSLIPNKKKYLNSKNFQGRKYWYGLNFEVEPKVVVIVEGPFDMLRFRSLGIPAIANLGVQMRNEEELSLTVSEEKIMQIVAKGCNKVVLCLDADEAGREATRGFTASFKKWGFGVWDMDMTRYLTTPEQTMDPGDCPMEVVEDLKKFIGTL
jgi:hypothetical protein